MQVDAGGSSGGPFEADALPDRRGGAYCDALFDVGEVPIQGGDTSAVVEDDVIPEAVGVVAGEDHGSAGCGHDQALRGGEIDAVVERRCRAGEWIDPRSKPEVTT